MALRADGEEQALAGLFAGAAAAPREYSPTVIPKRQNADAVTAIAAFAAAGLVGACSILGGLWLAGLVVPGWQLGPAGADAVYTLAIFAPMLILAPLGAWAFGSESFGLGARPQRGAGLGLAAGIGGLAIAWSYASLAGLSRWSELGETTVILFAAGTLLILLQASAEEALLRGWLQPVMAQHGPRWAAVLATATLFTALHLLGGVRSTTTLLNLWLGGLLFGLLALRTGGLAAPIAAHFGWNWAETMLLGLEPNPGVSGFGALWNAELVGAATWGGSEEGLNGSLGVTIVLVALSVSLIPRSALSRLRA